MILERAPLPRLRIKIEMPECLKEPRGTSAPRHPPSSRCVDWRFSVPWNILSTLDTEVYFGGNNGTRRVTAVETPTLLARSLLSRNFLQPLPLPCFAKTSGSPVLSLCLPAYSCHGRWFDAEGTQFVIATPLARRTAWSSSENNRAQPYRNSRRLCFMYKESGGVVSLTASPIACQRGIPPPAPMLAFNATSTGKWQPPSTLSLSAAAFHPRISINPREINLDTSTRNAV